MAVATEHRLSRDQIIRFHWKPDAQRALSEDLVRNRVERATEYRRKILENPNITFIETKDGGHCSYLGKTNGSDNDGRWAEQQVVEFLRRF